MIGRFSNTDRPVIFASPMMIPAKKQCPMTTPRNAGIRRR